MKKMIFGALALSLISLTSCRNEETTEVADENKETAVNTEVIQEVVTEVEDSMKVETEKAVDSLATPSEVEQETTNQ